MLGSGGGGGGFMGWVIRDPRIIRWGGRGGFLDPRGSVIRGPPKNPFGFLFLPLSLQDVILLTFRELNAEILYTLPMHFLYTGSPVNKMRDTFDVPSRPIHMAKSFELFLACAKARAAHSFAHSPPSTRQRSNVRLQGTRVT